LNTTALEHEAIMNIYSLDSFDIQYTLEIWSV